MTVSFSVTSVVGSLPKIETMHYKLYLLGFSAENSAKNTQLIDATFIFTCNNTLMFKYGWALVDIHRIILLREPRVCK